MHDAHISDQIRALHGAIIDIVSVINRPQLDARMVREAGIDLESALFPLLVGIGLRGPIGVVELADAVGRDYTTVSRQVAKLEELGLVTRQPSPHDARVRLAAVTKQGRAMVDAADAARLRRGRAIFARWSASDLATLVTLSRRFADALLADAEPPV